MLGSPCSIFRVRLQLESSHYCRVLDHRQHIQAAPCTNKLSGALHIAATTLLGHKKRSCNSILCRTAASGTAAEPSMRVFCFSDCHTDYAQNMRWCEDLSDNAYQDDILILAGDISDDQAVLRATFQLMAAKFGHVFFVPGNHDLWVRRKEREVLDSLGKLEVIKSLCHELGVRTEPAKVGGVWIAPIYSWYHASFDREPDVPGAPAVEKVMVDFHACRWPAAIPTSHDTSLAEFFDNLNEPALSNLAETLEMEQEDTGARSPLITFSHFLPLQALLPEKRMLFQPNLAKAVGSDYVQRRIEELRPAAHVFGHTHFSWDTVIDGVRYVQWPLAYPQERQRRYDGGKGFKPLLLYDTAQRALSPHQSTYWADFYRDHRRDPTNLEPAPWVKARMGDLAWK